jgi:hypothetical protein
VLSLSLRRGRNGITGARYHTNLRARRYLSHSTTTTATPAFWSMLATAFSELSMTRPNGKREQTLQL